MILNEIIIEGEVCSQGDTVYKGFEPYSISSMFALGQKKESYILGDRIEMFGLHYISADELTLTPQKLAKKVSTVDAPSFIIEVKPKKKIIPTRFAKVSDKALLILVKKKNKEAIQEFKNRRTKK